MTPYQTPHTQQTPRYGQQTPSQHLPSTAPHLNGTFLHPGAVTPSQRTPSYRNLSTQSPMLQPSPTPSPGSQSSFGSSHGHSRGSYDPARAGGYQSADSPRGYMNRNYPDGGRYGGNSESMDWQKAAEAWAARSKSKSLVLILKQFWRLIHLQLRQGAKVVTHHVPEGRGLRGLTTSGMIWRGHVWRTWERVLDRFGPPLEPTLPLTPCRWAMPRHFMMKIYKTTCSIA